MRFATRLMVLALALSGAGCGLGPSAPDTTAGGESNRAQAANPQGGLTGFFTRNVMYRVDKDIVIGMPNLNADVQVIQKDKPFVPKDVNDFVVRVHTGDFVVDQDSMAAIFNNYELNYPGSPLSDMKVEAMESGKLKMSGKMHKGLTVSFEMVGTLKPNGKGQLVLTPESIKSAGIPVKGLMNLIGLEMASLVNSRPNGGMKFDGDTVIIYPDRLLPPPCVLGFASGVKVEKGKVTMTFDDKVHRDVPPLPDPTAKNWILMYGGYVVINNHLVHDAKLQMVDQTPQDPMYYYMPLYREQLNAGFTVSSPNGTDISYLPDVHGTTVDLPPFRPNFPLPSSN